MTRTYTSVPIWTWKCDSCGHEWGFARAQSHLPSPDEMRTAGWFIAEKWGDRCPSCNILHQRKLEEAQRA